MTINPDRLIDDRLLEAAKPLLQVGGSDRILVIGCGDGRACRWLALQAEDGIVIGLDASDDRVREARAASVSQDNILYLWATAEQVPWQENFFTLALSFPAMADMENPEKAYREIGRVLEPGGRLWVIEPREPNREPGKGLGGEPSEDSAALLERLGFGEVRSHDAAPASRFLFARKPAPPGTGSEGSS
jgi:ubiquinone/menaquinone biosynthesis C-methylase UbiE